MHSGMSRVEKVVEFSTLPSNNKVDSSSKRADNAQQVIDAEARDVACLDIRDSGPDDAGLLGQINLSPAFLDAQRAADRTQPHHVH